MRGIKAVCERERKFDVDCNPVAERQGVELEPWFKTICTEIETAISCIVQPAGAKTFSINPTPKGNGVVPIKKAFVDCLNIKYGWGVEVPLAISSTESEAGPIDAVKTFPDGRRFAVEWETGNISSTHRALNKIALGILRGKIVGGALVLPSRRLYKYLTDRIGNFNEIEPYFQVWERLDYRCQCVISVYEIEHDLENVQLPLIPKGKDGMARGLVSSRLA